MALIRVHGRDEEPLGAYLVLGNVYTDSRNLYDQSRHVEPLFELPVAGLSVVKSMFEAAAFTAEEVYGSFVACD